VCFSDTRKAPVTPPWKNACALHVRGDISVLSVADSRLKVSQAQGNLSVLETRQVQLECVVVNRTSTASQLGVEWFVWKPNHPERETVARLSREATFHYGEQAAKNNLKGRLHLESPSPGVYRLFIQNVAVQDSGTYSCHVEEWLPSPSGVWYKRAEDTAGQTAVTVMRPGEASGPRPPPFAGSPGSVVF
jgi:immunoglobulin superfamily protein 2/3